MPKEKLPASGLPQGADEEPAFSSTDALRDAENLKHIRGTLLRIARARAKGNPRALQEVEDLVQDTLVKALDHAEEFAAGSKSSLLAWLIRIMTNRSIDIARAQKAREWASEPLDITSVDVEPYAAVAPAAESVVELKDTEKAIDSLATSEREVLLLFLENLEYQEIADSLGIPVGTVMSRLWRARKNLRKMTGRES